MNTIAAKSSTGTNKFSAGIERHGGGFRDHKGIPIGLTGAAEQSVGLSWGDNILDNLGIGRDLKMEMILLSLGMVGFFMWLRYR